MDQYVMDYRLEKWAKMIEAANSSGLPRSEWLKINNITKDQFYYWQKKVRKAVAERNNLLAPAGAENCNDVRLVEVPVSPDSINSSISGPISIGAVINVGRVSISISENASQKLIENLGRMIRNAL